MKTYGIAITAGGNTYHFHVSTTAQVRDLVNESHGITALKVYEEQGAQHRLLSDSEVLHDIFLADTARQTAQRVA